MKGYAELNSLGALYCHSIAISDFLRGRVRAKTERMRARTKDTVEKGGGNPRPAGGFPAANSGCAARFRLDLQVGPLRSDRCRDRATAPSARALGRSDSVTILDGSGAARGAGL